MNLKINYNPNSNIIVRVWDHAALGLKKDIGNRTTTPANKIEKLGNAILWTISQLPRSVKAITKTFQDPRIATIAFTALALLTTSLLFYPAVTTFYTKAAWMATTKLLQNIPLWAVKFSTYLITCFSIVGAGLRASGRFNNDALMKEFYDLPTNFPHNPSRLYAKELAHAAPKTYR